MAGVEALNFDSPDETRTPDKTRVDVIRVGGTTAARMTFEPGCQWPECVKPVVGTGAARSGTWVSPVRQSPHLPRGRNRGRHRAGRPLRDRTGP